MSFPMQMLEDVSPMAWRTTTMASCFNCKPKK